MLPRPSRLIPEPQAVVQLGHVHSDPLFSHFAVPYAKYGDVCDGYNSSCGRDPFPLLYRAIAECRTGGAGRAFGPQNGFASAIARCSGKYGTSWRSQPPAPAPHVCPQVGDVAGCPPTRSSFMVVAMTGGEVGVQEGLVVFDLQSGRETFETSCSIGARPERSSGMEPLVTGYQPPLRS